MKPVTIKLVASFLLLGMATLSAACNPYIMAWCNWQTDEVEVWQFPCLQLPFHVKVSAKKIDIFGIEIDLGLGPYTIIPDALPVPDFDSGKKIGSIPTKCKYLKDLNLGHPNEMGSPIANKILSMVQGTTPVPRAADASALSLVDTFPSTCPVPAALPPNFPMPLGATTGTCNSALSTYQVENETDSVAHFSLCPSQLVNRINVCSSPLALAVTPDASTVLVTCYNHTINWIDTATDKVSGALTTDAYPAGIALSPDGSKAYVTNYYDVSPNPALLVIDVAKRTVISSIPLPSAFPGVVAVTPDGSQAWVDYYESTFVDIVDLFSGTVAGHLDLQEATQNGIAFNPTGTRAYIASGANHLAVIDTATLKTLSKINVVSTPLDVTVSPDGSRVLVSSYAQGGSISVVDPEKNRVVQTIPSNGAIQGLSLVLGNIAIP